MITINDIANRTGVAPSTVSRVLSGNGYSGKKTRDLVLRTADDLAYTPNRVAQSLRLNQTKTLGLVIADVENSFYSRIAKTVETVAKGSGFHVVLCNSNDDPGEERDCLELLVDLRVDGILITPTGKNAAFLRSLLSRGIKIVQLDRQVSKLRCDSVVVNNRKGAEAAVEHLILQGHRRIGLLAGETHVTTGRQRLEGYRLALMKHRIPFDPGFVRESNFLRETALGAAQSLFNRTAAHGGIRRQQCAGRILPFRLKGTSVISSRVGGCLRRCPVDAAGRTSLDRRGPTDRGAGENRCYADGETAPGVRSASSGGDRPGTNFDC